MGNLPILNNRKMMIIAGMTPQDVINSKETTAQQKKMAYVFDSDGVAGYSQREADVFNATIITDKGENGISLWTRYQDGSKKETTCSLKNLDSFKYSPNGEIKPYLITNNKVQSYNSDKYFENPEKTIIRYKDVKEGPNYERGKHVIREEYYSDGKLKTQITKIISDNKSKIYARVDIRRYNNKGILSKHNAMRSFDLSHTPNI